MTDETIFAAALEKADPADRAAYLDAACGGDADLRRKVEGLLAAHSAAGDFLERPVTTPRPGPTTGGETATFGDEAPPDGGVTRTHGEVPEGEGGEVLGFLQPPAREGSLGRLAHYDVQEVIGRGGFGTVMKAFDLKLHRVVAIKVLAPQLATSGTARARFLREARAAAAVRDPHVVGIHAVEEEPLPYLVMECVSGQTLQGKLDKAGPLPVREVLRIGQQIAAGLAAAHAQGLVHRDIKPANILLENGVERVKITDFGLARAADDASISHAGVVAGTPMYMAPEQAKGEHIDHRADLFSLGSVLYAMLAGRPPFRATTTLAVLKRVAEDEPRPLREENPDVPRWMADVVAKLHAKDPAGRFQTAKEVSDLLAKYLTELQLRGDVTAPPPGQVPATTGVRERRTGTPRRRWLAAPVAILALACLGWFLVKQFGGRDVAHVRVEIDDPELEVLVDDKPLSTQAVGEAERADVVFHFDPGHHTVQVLKNHQRLFAEPIRLTANETVVIEARPDLLSWRSHEERSPFDAVRWRDATPEVKLDGVWYELLSLDGVPADRLLAQCRRDAPPRWRQRFEEDLVSTLAHLDHKPGERVRLELRDPGTNATQVRDVAMTADKRRALRNARLALRRAGAGGASPDDEGWVSLFNGKDLTGWKTFEELPGDWRVEDGVLVGREKMSYLVSERAFENFHFRGEFRVNAPSDAGVYFRSPGKLISNGSRRYVVGYEAQITETTGAYRTGDLCVETGRSQPNGEPWLVLEKANRAPPGRNEWFTLEILARGNLLEIRINGQTTARHTDDVYRFAQGHLALQVYTRGTVFQCRKMEIRELPPTGPSVGDRLAPFHPLVVTGPKAGTKADLAGTHGDKPAAWVFTRDLSVPVLLLVKKLEEEAVRATGQETGVFLVYLGDSEKLDRTAVGAAQFLDLKRAVVAVDTPGGPAGYRIAPDARVTVLLARDRTVRAAHTYRDANLTESDIKAVLADLLLALTPEPAWVSLFNAKDLSGWKTHPGRPGDWKVEGGTLVGRVTDKESHLFTDRADFEDFHFRVEAKINARADGGQVFRCNLGDTPETIRGYEANIGELNEYKTGSLWGIGGPPVGPKDDPVGPDTWFTQEVIARGNHVVIKVNGKTTADFVDPQARDRRGHLALQAWAPGTVIRFRKIEVKELPPEQPPPPAVAPFDAARAKELQEAWAKHLGVPVEISNTAGMKLRLVPPGTFTMGSNDKDENLNMVGPAHKATVTGAFYVGVHEVTRGQYDSLKKPGTKPGSEMPATGVSWHDAVEFCKRLSEREAEKRAGRVYRLPADVEWEYACRAGTATPYFFGEVEKIDEYAWFADNSGDKPHPVGRKKPNAWGLYDMIGNAGEWCEDSFGQYKAGDVEHDPAKPIFGVSPMKVLRSGNYKTAAKFARSTYRAAQDAAFKNEFIGLRVVCLVGAKPAAVPPVPGGKPEKTPEAAPPPRPAAKLLRKFDPARDETITRVERGTSGWLFSASREERTLRLYEIANPQVDAGGVLVFRVRMRAADVRRAFPEVVCRYADGTETRSPVPKVAAEGDTNLADYEVRCPLKPGARPEWVRLNLVAGGKEGGSVFLKGMELWHLPFDLPHGRLAAPAALPRKIDTERDESVTRSAADRTGWFFPVKPGQQVIRLFELENPAIDESAVLVLRGRFGTISARGAHLQIVCHFPDGREAASPEPEVVADGDTNPTPYEVRYQLKAGERPYLIRVNLVLKSSGKDQSVFVRELELSQAPAGDPQRPKP